MKSWIEIFRAGKQTDSKGREKVFTEADLDRIVETFDPAKHEPPVVIGHPKDNAPAWAWVEKLKRVGDTLFYRERGAQDEFTEMRRKGLFKKRSISLYPDGSLRHIGWLGAMPPAVKGLRNAVFGQADDCFNYLYPLAGCEFSEEESNMDEVERLKKKLEAEQARADKAEASANDYKEKADKATADFAEEQKKQRRTDIENFVEQGVKDAKILPAWKEMGIVDFMSSLEEGSGEEMVLEFCEGDNKDKTNQAGWFKKFISSFGEHPLFKEMTRPEDDNKGGTNDFKEDMADAEGMANYVNDDPADGQ